MKQSIGLEMDLGNKQQIIAGTPGSGTITEIGIENSLELGLSVTTNAAINKTAQVCMTTTETYSTSDGDLIFRPAWCFHQAALREAAW